jgi:hypothetical protein
MNKKRKILLLVCGIIFAAAAVANFINEWKLATSGTNGGGDSTLSLALSAAEFAIVLTFMRCASVMGIIIICVAVWLFIKFKDKK